jgi:hypothetical protein
VALQPAALDTSEMDDRKLLSPKADANELAQKPFESTELPLLVRM